MENENTTNDPMKQKNGTRESADYGFGKLTWKERVPLFNNPSCSTGGTQGTHEKQEKDIAKKRRISRNAEDMLIKAWRKVLSIKNLYDELGLSGYMGRQVQKGAQKRRFCR